MKTIELKAFVVARQWNHETEPTFHLDQYEYNECDDVWLNKTVGTVTVMVEVPETVDFTSIAIASLQAKKAKLQAEFSARMKEITDQLAKYQAIEYTPEAA